MPVSLLFFFFYQAKKDGDCSDMVVKATEVRDGCDQVLARGQEVAGAAKTASKK